MSRSKNEMSKRVKSNDYKLRGRRLTGGGGGGVGNRKQIYDPTSNPYSRNYKKTLKVPLLSNDN